MDVKTEELVCDLRIKRLSGETGPFIQFVSDMRVYGEKEPFWKNICVEMKKEDDCPDMRSELMEQVFNAFRLAYKQSFVKKKGR